MQKTYSITIKGKDHTWAFNVCGTTQHAKDWQRDGLHVEEVINRVPKFVVELGLLRPWIFVQDFLALKWLGL